MNATRLALAATAIAVLVPPIAGAQESGTELEEVVVTAQKRVQNFSDVGIASIP